MAQRGRPKGSVSKKVAAIDPKKVQELASYGLTRQQIAHFFGVSKNTILDQFSEDWNRGRSVAIAEVAKTLYQMAVGGDKAACMFYLKAQAKWNERGETTPDERDEMQARDGSGDSAQVVTIYLPDNGRGK